MEGMQIPGGKVCSGTAPRRFGKAWRRFGEASRRFAEASRRFGEASRRFAEASRGFAEASRRFAEASRRFGEVSRTFGRRGLLFGAVAGGVLTHNCGEAVHAACSREELFHHPLRNPPFPRCWRRRPQNRRRHIYGRGCVLRVLLTVGGWGVIIACGLAWDTGSSSQLI